MPLHPRFLLLLLPLALGGCDLAELLADPKVAQREAEAKAIGGACRYGLRSLEDCYLLNEKASKAHVYIGWKEMDLYMRENKIEGARATITKPEPKPEPVEEVMEEAPKKKGAKIKAH